MTRTCPRRLGFFTRLLDQATAGERYRLATEQIVHAERHGFDSAWVAQHHFDGHEGGLPAPFVFLAHVAARTSRIRLGTGIVTLPLDEPVRVAEDAAVFDLISNGRLELGLGSGGTPSAFAGFGRDSAAMAPSRMRCKLRPLGPVGRGGLRTSELDESAARKTRGMGFTPW